MQVPTIHLNGTSKYDLLNALTAARSVAVPQDEAELLTFGRQNRLKMVAVDDSLARVLLLSARSWEKMTHDGPLRKMVENAVNRGQSLILLDIGPHDLGQGYIKGDLGALDGAPRIKDGYVRGYDLFSGVRVAFHQQAEPESHIQPGATDDSLWMGLPRGSTWIWDRLRAGLIAPAADMDVSGLSPAAFIAEWTGRGAVAKAIADGSYIAYELAGYYAFSAKANDKATIAALRTKVKFLAEDAPALQDVVNPNGAVEQVDLARAYKNAANGKAESLLVLATAGKGLTRSPIEDSRLGRGRGM